MGNGNGGVLSLRTIIGLATVAIGLVGGGATFGVWMQQGDQATQDIDGLSDRVATLDKRVTENDQDIRFLWCETFPQHCDRRQQ